MHRRDCEASWFKDGWWMTTSKEILWDDGAKFGSNSSCCPLSQFTFSAMSQRTSLYVRYRQLIKSSIANGFNGQKKKSSWWKGPRLAVLPNAWITAVLYKAYWIFIIEYKYKWLIRFLRRGVVRGPMNFSRKDETQFVQNGVAMTAIIHHQDCLNHWLTI
jgi:hypothetical protein